MSTTIKAVKATIKLGDIELDGYQLPNGDYAMSQNGCKTLDILIGNSTGKKYAKPLILKDNLCGELAKIEGQNASARLMSLDTFSAIVNIYGSQLNNKKCQAVMFACFAEAIEKRLDKAFDVQRSDEERNERMKVRIAGKIVRRTLTDAIKDYMDTHDVTENYRRFIYANCSDYLNLVVLGVTAKRAKEHYKITESALLRNKLPAAALKELSFTEELASRLIDDRKLEPLEAVKQACQSMMTKTIGL